MVEPEDGGPFWYSTPLHAVESGLDAWRVLVTALGYLGMSQPWDNFGLDRTQETPK